MSTTEEENWKVDCSDDENYGLTYSEMVKWTQIGKRSLIFSLNCLLQLKQWVPDPATTIELFESYTEDSTKECSLFTFDWVCPGRKEIKPAETSGDTVGEEQKYWHFIG